jgi:hypothetical protein
MIYIYITILNGPDYTIILFRDVKRSFDVVLLASTLQSELKKYKT